MGLSRPRPAPAVWNRCFASTQPRWTADVRHRVPGQGRGLAGVGHQPRRIALAAAEAGGDALEPLRALADRTHRDLGLRHRADQPLVERVVIEQPAHRGLALQQAGDERLRLGQHSPRPPLHAIRHRRGLPVVGYVKTYPPPHAPPGALGQGARALTAGERSGLAMGTLSTAATCAWAPPGRGRVRPPRARLAGDHAQQQFPPSHDPGSSRPAFATFDPRPRESAWTAVASDCRLASSGSSHPTPRVVEPSPSPITRAICASGRPA